MATTSHNLFATPQDEHGVIASLEDTFGLHIKSIAEATRIRGAIAAHVSSFIINDGLDGSSAVQSITKPGNEIRGIRRKYLDALSSNLEARNQYDEIRHRTITTKPVAFLTNTDKEIGGRVLRHIEMSQLARHLQELEIRGRYAENLEQESSAVCNLDLPLPTQDTTNGLVEKRDQLSEDIASATATAKSLTIKLQKALVQATHQLEAEKISLTDIKSKYASSDMNPSVQAQLDAITAARAVLVQELEARLAQPGSEELEESELHLEGKDVKINVKERQKRVGELYQRYVTARKSLLLAVATATRPLPATKVEKQIVEAEETHQKSTVPKSTLPAITQRLIPLLQLHASSTAMRSFSSSLFSKERSEALEALERLSEESHLLPSHPMNANVVMVEADEVDRHVKAWEFAAREADMAAREMIGRQVEEGMKGVDDGHESLKNWRRYLGESLDTSSDGQKTDTTGAGWRGLHGRLGMDTGS